MKYLISLILIIGGFTSFSQTKYFFFEVRATGKATIELKGNYPETDSVLIEKMEVSKRGDTTYTWKTFRSYSDAFNALSKLGMEYVEMANLPLVGGATSLFSGNLSQNYIIWRKP